MEIWKPLKNFPSYDGSSEGRIRNIRTQRILKTYINEKGYETVCLRKNGRQYTVKVSKVIAETFLGEHPGMDVRNKNGERSKSSVDTRYGVQEAKPYRRHLKEELRNRQDALVYKL